jgi:hypothetical protein
MLSLPALSLSSVNGHTPRLGRRWSLVLTVLLITLLAHLVVLHWLNNQLQAISLFNDADDDDNAISVSLLRPEPQRTSRPPPQSATPPVPTPPATQPVESQAAEAKAAPESVPATSAPSETAINTAPTEPSTPQTFDTSGLKPAPNESVTNPQDAVANQTTAVASINAVFDKANPPPPAELVFNAIGITKDGRNLNGSGIMQWRHDGRRYTLDTEISVLVFTLAKNRSEGDLSALGISPNLYVEKRFGRAETNTHFQQQAKVISFSASTAIIATNGGEQDRGSWIWQLASLGRGDPNKFEVGLQMEMFVASAKGVDSWRIKVSGKEQLKLPDGEVSAWRLSVVPGLQSFDKQFDLWLAPERQWYPVRLQHEDKNGNRIELLLAKISAK